MAIERVDLVAHLLETRRKRIRRGLLGRFFDGISGRQKRHENQGEDRASVTGGVHRFPSISMLRSSVIEFPAASVRA
jgi:hypothetical protein